MAKKVPNNPIAPAVEAPTDPAVVVDECEQLKIKHNINTDTWNNHEEPKHWHNQSHHILQNACVEDYISKGLGWCVLLVNSERGTPHQTTTRRQNERRDNKANNTPGPRPATDFGGLKKLAKGDLEESFKAMKIDPIEAEKLAQCLVDEAEEHTKKRAKEDKDEDMDDDSPVEPTGGCFPAWTLVWLDGHERRRIANVTASDSIEGLTHTRAVVRRDTCRSELVTLHLGQGSVALAPFHRVLTASGRYVRAATLRAGMQLQIDSGPETLVRVQRDARPRRIHSVGVGESFECRIGQAGLWVQLPNSGVRVTETVRLVRFRVRTRKASRGSRVGEVEP